MPHAHKPHSIEHLHQSKHWYLKQIKVFADLPEAYKRELLDMSQMVLYRKHATISFPGKPGDTIFLLKEGRVKIS